MLPPRRENAEAISPRPRRANFDPVARLYRWAEFAFLGTLLTRTRTEFLPAVQHTRQALVLGDGDGRFMAALLRIAPTLQAVAVDSSAAMLALLRKRCAFADARLQTRLGGVVPLPSALPLAATDLIVTHFLLDCLSQSEVEELAVELAHGVQDGCLWLISEFGIPGRQPWRLPGRLYVRALYAAFRLLTGLPVQRLPEICKPLTDAGFQRIHRRERLRGLLYSEVWQLKR